MDFLQNTLASFVSLVPVTLAQSLILADPSHDLQLLSILPVWFFYRVSKARSGLPGTQRPRSAESG